MDEITKGVVETTSVPENTEQLLKININSMINICIIWRWHNLHAIGNCVAGITENTFGN